MKESTKLNPCPFFGGSEKIEEQLAEFRKPWPPKELEEMPEHDKLILYLCYRAIYLDYMERQQKLKEDGDTKHGDTIPDSSILESYTKRMEASVDNDNKEEGHVKCDGVICDLLRTLGYGAVVDAYDDQEKWYS